MNYDDIFVPSVTGAITAFIGWLVGKRKENIDINASEIRSEEHTSELQSHHDLVCRLLLEKKKKNKATNV